MRCKCKARFTSNMDKYNVEMHVTREIPAANLEIKYDYPKKKVLIYICKDFSGYNDTTSMTITVDADDMKRIAEQILSGEDQECMTT